MILAAIFDMDGTLIDSEPFWAEAEQTVFGGLGVPITPELAATTTGMTTAAVTRHWYEMSPWEGTSLAEAEQQVLDQVAHLIAQKGKPMPGVPGILQRMQKAGLKLALATNSPNFLIPIVLDRLSLRPFFETWVGVDDVHHGKPAPDIYTTAAQRLGVAPQHCLAIEDSATGLQAALSAGMKTVAVVPPHLTPHRLFHKADLSLRSLEHLRAEDWEGL